MQYSKTVKNAGAITPLIEKVNEDEVAIVITTIISAETSCNCILMIFDNLDNIKHKMIFSLTNNETIFLDSKLILTNGDSLKVQSIDDSGNGVTGATFTAMYDLSDNI